MTLNLTFQGHSRSSKWPFKVKCEGFIGLAIYAFLLMVNSNIGPSMAQLRDIRVWNLVDLDFDLSSSLKVKSNGAVGLSIYDFLLVSNSNHMSISHRLWDLTTLKFSPYLLSLGQNFGPISTTLSLTFQGHSRSNVKVSMDWQYIVSYWWLIATYGLTWLLYEI